MTSCTAHGSAPSERGTPPKRRPAAWIRDRAKAARKFADRLGTFQDLLGRHQDAVVATDEAHAAAAAHEDDLGLVVAAGRVMEREIQAARQERRRVKKAWKALERKKRRRWMRREPTDHPRRRWRPVAADGVAHR